MEKFYTTLPSNSCSGTQPNNRAASYIIDFESHVPIQGQWEVALTEFSFNYSPPISTAQAKIDYSRFERASMNISFEIYSQKLNIDDINPSTEISITTISHPPKIVIMCKKVPFEITFINDEEASKLGSSKSTITSTKHRYEFENPVDLTYSGTIDAEMEYGVAELKRSDKTFYDYPTFTSNSEIIEFYKNEEIFNKFFIDGKGLISFSLLNSVKELTFDAHISKTLGFWPRQLFRGPNGYVFVAQKKPSMGVKFNQYYIYSSIINPIIVGGSKIPLLRTIWVESKHELGDVINEVVDHPMYLPTSTSIIQKIEVEIRDDAGHYIPFPEGSKSSVTLHFKKV